MQGYSLVDPQNLIREIYNRTVTSKILYLENYPLYGICLNMHQVKICI